MSGVLLQVRQAHLALVPKMRLLQAIGFGPSAIARQLGVSRDTVASHFYGRVKAHPPTPVESALLAAVDALHAGDWPLAASSLRRAADLLESKARA